MTHQEYIERRDEILHSVRFVENRANELVGSRNDLNDLIDAVDKKEGELIHQAKQAIDQLILDVIGEDEDAGNSIEVQNPFTPYKLHRNQLRQQQRNVIKGE